MREQFEKLPEIAKRMIAVEFNNTLNRYESKSPVLIECFEAALYLNGAWYAYQEQQKKIENIASLIDSLVSNSEQFGFESEQVEGVLMDLCITLRGKND